MENKAYDELTERLLEGSFRVIDFLPRQVPESSADRYFRVERFLLDDGRMRELYGRFSRLLLKLSCYAAPALGTETGWETEPAPEKLLAAVARCGRRDWRNLLFFEEEALITLYGGDLCMTLYGGSEALTDLVRQLAAGEGLFLR